MSRRKKRKGSDRARAKRLKSDLELRVILPPNKVVRKKRKDEGRRKRKHKGNPYED